jgi:hypothetical protein
MPVATPDLSGKTFGLLTAIRMVGRNKRGLAIWECSCTCGNLVNKVGTNLQTNEGRRQSCGCALKKRPYTKLYKHGKTDTPEFRAWSAMIYRCHSPSSKAYKWYGDRGIGVCREWRDSFEAFLAHVGPRPTDGKYSIDRKDNDRGYEPGNVHWTTDIPQQRNRRNVRVLTFNGETMSLPAWAERLGIKNDILSKRIRQGWPLERALKGYERIHTD